jgi:hypothetical protein
MLLRRHVSTLLLGAALLGAAHAATLGQAAPDFTLPDTDGKVLRLSDYRGRHVVLEWNNPGCPFVRKHYDSGNMQALQREATAKNVVWLTINSTETAHADYLSPAQLERWMSRHKAAPTATLMDEEGTAGRAYAARVTPHMFIIDPQGRLIYAGGIDSIASARAADINTATNYVRTGLAEALAGKPLSQPATQAYGCTIKYR